MNELARYDVTSKDLAKGRNMKIGAVAAPVVLTILPVIIFTILFVLFGTSSPGAAITLIFFGAVSAIIGLVIGLAITGLLMYRHSNWTKEMRERIAADGIRAEEIGWFTKELTGTERKALKALAAADPLLEDAFRETLASRLTATRIVRSSKRELQLAQRRQTKLKYLKSENSKDFQEEIKKDIDKLSSIHTEAKQMQAESETRLQMIEAAAMRGTNMADSELALKKLTARTAELPFALEAARMEDEIRKELEKEPLE
jgi:uncharacterized integral membrane protein